MPVASRAAPTYAKLMKAFGSVTSGVSTERKKAKGINIAALGTETRTYHLHRSRKWPRPHNEAQPNLAVETRLREHDQHATDHDAMRFPKMRDYREATGECLSLHTLHWAR